MSHLRNNHVTTYVTTNVTIPKLTFFNKSNKTHKVDCWPLNKWPQRETPNSDLEDTSGNHFEFILGSWLPEEPAKILSKKWFQKHMFYRSKWSQPPFFSRRNAREGHKVLCFANQNGWATRWVIFKDPTPPGPLQPRAVWGKTLLKWRSWQKSTKTFGVEHNIFLMILKTNMFGFWQFYLASIWVGSGSWQ